MKKPVALRELSLRFVADETEEELLGVPAIARSGGELWETTERSCGRHRSPGQRPPVIRRAARIASRIKADLIAVHVISGDAPAKRQQGRAGGTLGRRWGADGRPWRGTTWPTTIFAAAIDQQITQIVVGTSV